MGYSSRVSRVACAKGGGDPAMAPGMAAIERAVCPCLRAHSGAGQCLQLIDCGGGLVLGQCFQREQLPSHHHQVTQRENTSE